MTEIIDLHTHSTASDGSMSPAQLVRHAKDKGLTAVALTDHDTVEGISEALDEGNKIGIEVIPGIEISTNYKPEMHILGYFFDNERYLNVQKELTEVRKGRENRNYKIINRLNELGIPVTEEELKEISLSDTIGRPHFARLLIEKGYVKTMQEAFDKYLGKDGLAYFKRQELEPIDGINLIKKAGGIPVLAHPALLKMNYNDLDKLLMELKEYGLSGIEAIYSENSKEETGNLLRLAIKHELLVTGGSDFHGTYKNEIEIGIGRGNLNVPYELLEKLKSAKLSV
ncbi:PHP domain-containing protein [Ruminiclostridium herbifermentans]|uniref:PHP domain-containing protein n=1 Tax=Ruminiclostridium herbifermentans TaxID=2488810 RepID=A0A4U7JDI0_9FIRM|nr:PHP domain-containing protein [Ruminiclostridium herbifermentans]QNU67666.1 PHP domain-containing protein [Ruminiclostridium herbifermentans]